MTLTKSFRVRLADYVGHHLLFKDRVYTHADWEYQKTWKRYLPRPITSFRVFWGFAAVVISLTVWAAMICVYHAWLENTGAPAFWNDSQQLWQPFSLSSFCLALLLVHRTTASYNRWWEARTVWGSVLNVVRNLMRTAASPWGFPASERALLDMFARFVIAMPYLLKAHMRGIPFAPDVETLLLPEELAYLLAAKQPCLRAAQVASCIIGRAMPGDGFKQTRVWVDEQLTLYINNVGACERIFKTAIPVAFTRHLTRFLLVWLMLLPFALWPVMGWCTPAVEAVMSFLLVGTENIGIQVEEPFCILTMDAFCTGMEASVVEIMETHASAEEIVEEVGVRGKPQGFRRDKGAPATPLSRRASRDAGADAQPFGRGNGLPQDPPQAPPEGTPRGSRSLGGPRSCGSNGGSGGSSGSGSGISSERGRVQPPPPLESHTTVCLEAVL